jgi:threo-3-hydroxy-L-aspartate ammonia-lyase
MTPGSDGDLVTLDQLREAHKRVAGIAVRTPLLPAAWAGNLWLKAESLQPIGAFKIRGAYAKMSALSDAERRRGVIAPSSGNHAQAVAYAAREFGVPAVIVMPESAAAVKIDATRALGADVVLVPVTERESRAELLAAEHGYVMIPPYDDADVIAGQGTVGLEIVEDLPDVAAVVVPVSGGGLISGVAAAVKQLRPQARVVGAEPELAGDAAESFRQRRRVSWSPHDTARTVADGLRVRQVGSLPWRHIREYVDDIVTVTEEQILDAVRLLALRSRLVVEPSGAVSVAAVLAGAARVEGPIVAVLSGGNVDPALLARILAS